MKWFQHHTDSHSNPKIRNLIRQKGCEGYGFLQICRELVGKYGENYRLKPEKCWKTLLIEASLLDETSVDQMLQFLAENKDIDCKSLEKDELYIPKMKEYSDNWTKRLPRNYRETTAQLPIDKIRLDKIRLEYIKLKGWVDISLSPDDYSRINGGIKKLLSRAGGKDETVIDALRWMAQQTYEWTLETALRKFPDFLKSGAKSDAYKKAEEALNATKLKV